MPARVYQTFIYPLKGAREIRVDSIAIDREKGGIVGDRIFAFRSGRGAAKDEWQPPVAYLSGKSEARLANEHAEYIDDGYEGVGRLEPAFIRKIEHKLDRELV